MVFLVDRRSVALILYDSNTGIERRADHHETWFLPRRHHRGWPLELSKRRRSTRMRHRLRLQVQLRAVQLKLICLVSRSPVYLHGRCSTSSALLRTPLHGTAVLDFAECDAKRQFSAKHDAMSACQPGRWTSERSNRWNWIARAESSSLAWCWPYYIQSSAPVNTRRPSMSR
jgi:hypothetical protein